MKRLIGMVLALMLLLPGTAQAHTGNFWETWGNDVEVVVFYLSDNTGWTTANINAINAAMSEINSQLDGTGAPGLLLNTLDHKDWNGCGSDFNIIEKVGDGALGGSAAGKTVMCQNALHTALSRVWTRIETPSNIYWGSDIPEPAGDQGARGVLVHELLHGLGMEHFPDSDDSVCDYGLGQGGYATMCIGPYWNGTYLQFNRNITLSTHDVHSVNNAY